MIRFRNLAFLFLLIQAFNINTTSRTSMAITSVGAAYLLTSLFVKNSDKMLREFYWLDNNKYVSDNLFFTGVGILSLGIYKLRTNYLDSKSYSPTKNDIKNS